LSESGGGELARELHVPLYDPTTQQRRKEWMQLAESEQHKRVATSLAMGTVGAVALDSNGIIAAGTSTGGRGHERIGRVSDSATPAGNYASAIAGVSCTGVGEDILDEGLATRIVVRVEDGMSLQAAMNKTFAEAKSRQRDFGAIALSHTGEIVWATTTDVILVAHHDGDRVITSLPDPAS
ncbi:MAG: isoaspartyl peptidase/L-asparaginase, partial [Cyanobacteria bacterium J06648_11]